MNQLCDFYSLVFYALCLAYCLHSKIFMAHNHQLSFSCIYLVFFENLNFLAVSNYTIFVFDFNTMYIIKRNFTTSVDHTIWLKISDSEHFLAAIFTPKVPPNDWFQPSRTRTGEPPSMIPRRSADVDGGLQSIARCTISPWFSFFMFYQWVRINEKAAISHNIKIKFSLRFSF